jgi:hypothetical protein
MPGTDIGKLEIINEVNFKDIDDFESKTTFLL